MLVFYDNRIRYRINILIGIMLANHLIELIEDSYNNH